MAQIIPLGFVKASATALAVNVPVRTGYPLRCNKILVQAFNLANSMDFVFVGLNGVDKTSGNNVLAALQAGQSLVIGDERDSNTLDPGKLEVDSISGTAVVTGLLYQR